MISNEKTRSASDSLTLSLSLLVVFGFLVYVDYFLIRRIQPVGVRGPLIISLSVVFSVILTALHRKELSHRKSWHSVPLGVWVLLGLANSVVGSFLMFNIGSHAVWWINHVEGQNWAWLWLLILPFVVNGGLVPKRLGGSILYPKRVLFYCSIFGILSLLLFASTLDIWGKMMLVWMFVVGLSSGLIFRILERRVGLRFDRMYEDERLS